MKKLFDPEFGQKVRAIVTLIMGVATAVVAVLQGVLDLLPWLPDWEVIGSVALFLRTIISVLTTWTKVGNVTE